MEDIVVPVTANFCTWKQMTDNSEVLPFRSYLDLWFSKHRLLKQRLQILNTTKSWYFLVPTAFLTKVFYKKRDRNYSSSGSASKAATNLCCIFCYKSSSQRHFTVASKTQIPFMQHFLPFSVMKQLSSAWVAPTWSSTWCKISLSRDWYRFFHRSTILLIKNIMSDSHVTLNSFPQALPVPENQ